MLETSALTTEDVRAIVREELERAQRKDPARKKAAIVASRGTLDLAYPPLILASTAAAMGMETHVFFTFYGLNVIHRDFEKKLKVSPVGNPAMPMPVPMPNLVTALPGMGPMATSMMRSMFRKRNVATIAELLDASKEAGAHLIACQMTMEVFGYGEGDFVDGVEYGGAAAFLSHASKAHVTLFI